jgi:hypothetical protein
MATQVQFRRGTTSQNNAFTGAQGELTIDTDVYTIRIHDGTTAGGKQVPTLTATQTFTNKTMSTNSSWNGNAISLGYGGTGAALTGVAGAVVYSTGSAMALSLAGTSGQVLTSGGTSGPTWVSASALSTGTATTATTATNIAGGSAGYLVYQEDTNTTAFIAPGDSGFILRSTGASTAPSWVTSALTIGSTPAQVGDTTTSFAGVRSITMGNGSHGNATVGTITGTGPWTATLTGISSTTGINVGQNITATGGTGTLFGGSPTSVVVASVVSGTSITVTVTGGTTPTAGTITSLTTFGFLQVPTGTTAQRPWVPANGMIRYNSTQSTFEGYSSSAWSSLGGVKSVDGYTYIQAETSAGASNGDLDFYAENSGGDGATQIGQWNRTNLKDYTGTLVGTQTTQNVFNATATTVNAFGAATTLTIGASSSGTATIRNSTVAITNNATVGGTLTVTGNQTNTGDLAVNGGDITTTATSASIFNTNATTVDAFEAATTINIGASSGDTTIQNNLVVTGNLTINGTTTTLNTSTYEVEDSLIYIGTGNSGNSQDIGFAGHATISTVYQHLGLVRDATDGIWKLFSGVATEPLNSTLDFTSAVYDPLKMGALDASTGTFSGAINKVTITAPASSATLTLANGSSLITSGAHATTLTTTGTTGVTLPTTGTLATLAGTETFTNKTLTGPTLTLPIVNNTKQGYSTTATAAGTTTLTVNSNYAQFFTGTTTQTLQLPAPQTMTLGMQYLVVNNSTGTVSVVASNSAATATLIGGLAILITCVDTTAGGGASSWSVETVGFSGVTGTGNAVLATSPTLVTPALGTPASGTLTSCTGLPLSTGVTGTLPVANGGTGVTSSTGTGNNVLSADPTFTGTLTAATVSATTLTETSDERLKTNITPLTNALETIQALEGKAFIKDGKASVGLIAQQVQKVLPQVVVTGDDEMQTLSVQYGNIVAVLIEAVKEQQKQIEELKAKLGN